MKILIAEDSLGLISVYSSIIKDILNTIKPNEKAEIVGVVAYDEYVYFKDLDFDLAILDWNIVGGTSRPIVEDVMPRVKHAVFITGYAMNYEVIELSDKYNMPVISKPTSDLEIREILMEAISIIQNVDMYDLAI